MRSKVVRVRPQWMIEKGLEVSCIGGKIYSGRHDTGISEIPEKSSAKQLLLLLPAGIVSLGYRSRAT